MEVTKKGTHRSFQTNDKNRYKQRQVETTKTGDLWAYRVEKKRSQQEILQYEGEKNGTGVDPNTVHNG